MSPSQQAQQGVELLKQAVINHLVASPRQTAAELVRTLDVNSDFEGRQKGWLLWSILGLLVNEGLLVYEQVGRSKYYSASA